MTSPFILFPYFMLDDVISGLRFFFGKSLLFRGVSLCTDGYYLGRLCARDVVSW